MPEQTIIYYSKKYFINRFIGIVIFTIFTGFVSQSFFPVIFFSLYLLVVIAFEWNKLINHVFKNEPQIILNKNGIETPLTPFTKWENVSDVNIFDKQVGKVIKSYFIFTRINGLNYEYEELEITEYDSSVEELKYLIDFYKNA